MFIENAVLKIDIGCDNDGCQKIKSLEFYTNDGQTWPRPTEPQILIGLTQEGWLVIFDKVFCSAKCKAAWIKKSQAGENTDEN